MTSHEQWEHGSFCIMRALSAYIAGALKKPLPKDVFSGERNFLFAFPAHPRQRN